MTTGMLQQLVYLLGEAPGRRAVVVGAEHVSADPRARRRRGRRNRDCRTHHETFAAFRAALALRFRTLRSRAPR